MKRLKGWIFILIPVLIFTLVPFYWTIVTSLKPESEIISAPIRYIAAPPTIENYLAVWHKIGFSIFFRNSFIVSGISVILITILALIGGYAIARYQFRGRRVFMIILLSTQFIPTTMLLIPLAVVYRRLALLNTYRGLIMCYCTFQLPFTTILMRSFIKGIPFELEEAARIDGCTGFQAVIYILTPLLLPGLIAAASFAFIGCWNEFLFALMFNNTMDRFTIPVGLNYLQGQYSISYGSIAAGSIIAMIPPVILFAYVQRYLVSGLSAGAVKG